MLSLSQIRAARGLLNWSQSKMAEMTGLSLTAINNIDREISHPRSSTLKVIQRIFELHGVEFTQGDGVKRRDTIFNIEIFEGKDSGQRYFEDVVETLKVTGGIAYHLIDNEFAFIDEKNMDILWYYDAFQQYGLSERVMIREGQYERMGPYPLVEYRWSPHTVTSEVLSSVYGNKYCMYLPDKVIVIENELVADTHRKKMKALWKASKPIPHRKSKYEEMKDKIL